MQVPLQEPQREEESKAVGPKAGPSKLEEPGRRPEVLQRQEEQQRLGQLASEEEARTLPREQLPWAAVVRTRTIEHDDQIESS